LKTVGWRICCALHHPPTVFIEEFEPFRSGVRSFRACDAAEFTTRDTFLLSVVDS
jgi:hypothetical protein